MWVSFVKYTLTNLLTLYLHLLLRCILSGALALAGLPVFPSFDWRFNEFPNAACHALYSSCIELMALPVGGAVVGDALYDIILKG